MRFLFLFFMSLPAVAQTYLDAEAFETYTRGKTLYFSMDGQAYGAEQYLQNQRVRWQYPDGQCTEGAWYGSGSSICFQYENVNESQCWLVWENGSGLSARRAEFADDRPISLERIDTLPLPCAGPDLGV